MGDTGICATDHSNGALSVEPAPPWSNERWDDFLILTPGGRFQQSSMWAAAKAEEGWRSTRLELTVGQTLAGGVQLLWCDGPLGRIGLVDQGPVIREGLTSKEALRLQQALMRMIERGRVRVVLFKPPMANGNGSGSGIPTRMIPVRSGVAAWRVRMDAGGSLARLTEYFEPAVLARIQRRRAGGLIVQERGRADLGLLRPVQEAMPDWGRAAVARPDVLAEPRAVWEAFRRRHCVRLHALGGAGHPLAACLSIVMGTHLTAWRVQMESESSDNTLALAFGILEWAHCHGLRSCEFPASFWKACVPERGAAGVGLVPGLRVGVTPAPVAGLWAGPAVHAMAWLTGRSGKLMRRVLQWVTRERLTGLG